jgi:hypothetical protein
MSSSDFIVRLTDRERRASGCVLVSPDLVGPQFESV